MPKRLQSVVETKPNLSQCKGNLTEAQRGEVIDMIAADLRPIEATLRQFPRVNAGVKIHQWPE